MAGVKPPRGLGREGKAIWSAVSENFELEAHEVEVLRQVAVVADRIAALDAVVARDGVLLGDHVHPALAESRMQRVTLGRLLAGLRLPDLEDHRPQRRGGFRKAYQIKQVPGGA